MIFSADFETTTDPEDCRVWAVGLFEIFSLDNFIYGNSIDWLFHFLELQNEKTTLYFHNLKFDGEFILNYLFSHGYVHVKEKRGMDNKQFTTLISSMGAFYSMYIKLENGNAVEIIDSLKILPFSVEVIAKSFNLPIRKLELDYTEYREVNHALTKEEADYLRNDVEIVAKALETLFSQNLTKMTQGSNALSDYKNIVGEKNFKKWFPKCRYDEDVRLSYKGGFTYLNPIWKNKTAYDGIVLDVNSLYPSVMYERPLPYGEGRHFEGRYKEDKIYNLYVQIFTCNFELKEGYIPTLQIKNSSEYFNPIEYLTSSNGIDVTLCLTSVDLELFFEHYDVYNIVWHHGWKFKSTVGLFKDYIDKWIKVKIESTENGNMGMRTLAKLMLNALYGKFATSPKGKSKYPYWDDINEQVRYKIGDIEQRESLYIPIGTFITAWARYKTIETSQKIKTYSIEKYGEDKYIYSDTDSIHTTLSVEECEQFLQIHPTKLGYWALEDKFKRGKFLRQKCYIEDIYKSEQDIEKYKAKNPNLTHHCSKNSILKVTCSGMPSRCYENVTFDNYELGNHFKGKLQMKHVKGGIVLVDIDFTLKT